MATRHGAIVLTSHAIDRFRLRVESDASAEAIASAVLEAELRWTTPPWVAWGAGDSCAAAWLTGAGWAMPVRRRDEGDRNGCDFVALTCFARPRLSKADRRQLREQAEEDSWAA